MNSSIKIGVIMKMNFYPLSEEKYGIAIALGSEPMGGSEFFTF